FLGREFTQRNRNFSEATAIEIDGEVRRIVSGQYERAKLILLENKGALDRIAGALLEWETLDGEEVNTLMAGGTITKSKPPVRSNTELPKKVEEKKEKSKILDALGGLTAPVPKAETGKA